VIVSKMAPLVQTLDIRGTSKAYYAPATILHSQGLIHVSGQAGTNSQGYAPPDYESQIQLALLNLHKIIIAASTSISSILKLTLYIVDYDPEQRKHTPLLKAFLGSHRPAITLVPVPQLAVKECLFEIDAVIATDTSQTATPIPKHLSSSNPKHVDVVIMGAGLAGLAAAYQITKAGLSCVVLEARDRVGGRTWSHKLPDGGVIDVGAAWINDTNQSRAYALARAFGAELIEQNTSGDCVLQDKNGSLKQFPYGQLPPVSHHYDLQIYTLIVLHSSTKAREII
jgi:monoamine oxidase